MREVVVERNVTSCLHCVKLIGFMSFLFTKYQLSDEIEIQPLIPGYFPVTS